MGVAIGEDAGRNVSIPGVACDGEERGRPRGWGNGLARLDFAAITWGELECGILLVRTGGWVTQVPSRVVHSTSGAGYTM
jgi:hypothetical protein